MIEGIFLDPRIWKIDYQTNPFWKPNQFGVNIDMHPDAFNIPKQGINPKYKFAIATELWEIPMRKALEYLRAKGLKIIMVPREVSKTKAHRAVMFAEEKFKYNGSYYFKPDYILAPGEQYKSVWEVVKDVPIKLIGYPRYEVYLKPELLRSRQQARARYGIDLNKKVVFFPSYPPVYVQSVGGKNVMRYIDQDLENTMQQLEKFALKHQQDTQVVVKIHPYAQKCYDKKAGSGKEVFGTLEKYFKKPTDYLKVIGDSRLDSSVSRDMILAADFVVGSISMMMLEAALTNKPVLNIRLEQERELKDLIAFDGNMKTVYNAEDIPAQIEDMVAKPTDYLVDSVFVEHYLHKVDGKFCERLCESIKEIVK